MLGDKGFLATKHTRRFIHSEFVTPRLRSRGGDGRGRPGSHGLAGLARERVAELLAREPVGLPADTMAAMCDQIDACARRIGLSEWPDPRRLLEGRSEHEVTTTGAAAA